jgi:hypothetical protein
MVLSRKTAARIERKKPGTGCWLPETEMYFVEVSGGLKH